VVLRHYDKQAYRGDLKENGGEDCGIDVVCLKRHQEQNNVWLCMCVHMNACAYFIHFTHTQISLIILFAHFRSESFYNFTSFEGRRCVHIFDILENF